MNKERLEKIRNRLIEIKNGINVNKKECIYDNLCVYTYPDGTTGSVFNKGYDKLGSWIEKQINEWPDIYIDKKYSYIDENYPIEGNEQFYIDEANGTLWDNPRRMALVDYLITRATKYLV